jgi:DNA-binding NtrC family response regulator
VSIRKKALGAESRWLMDRVMAGDLLEGADKYVHLLAPGREMELSAAIRARARELAEGGTDMAVLASFETLLLLFDGDERQTVLCLQHVMGEVLTGPYESAFKTVSERKNPLDKIGKACRAEEPFYGAGRDIDFERPGPNRFEMNVRSVTARVAGHLRTNDLVKRRPCCPPSLRRRPPPRPQPRGGASALDDRCTHRPKYLGCDERILLLVRHSGVRMGWILGLDGTAQGREIVEALCRSCPGLAERTDPDPADRSGVVVCRAAAPDLLEVLAIARDTGTHVIVVVRSLPSVDPWQLLVAGAADVVPWQGDPRPVGARLARVDEVERIVDSAQVTDVILGDSPALRDALRELVTAARFGAGPILILGETGTGKELAARVAHAVGGAGGPGDLVVVDCTTIVPTLSGSELFGHERGAFTGAVGTRTGAFSAANGGTLMLDEIGELPLDLQSELLRVVQEGTYKRVGSDRWQRSRFRLICATQRDLLRDVHAGRFRAEFYYRIAATTVRLPPLAARQEDIGPLFRHFFVQARGSAEPAMLTEPVERALRGRAYPGNLRDLRQLAYRVAARYVGPGPVTPGDLPPDDRPAVPEPAAVPEPTVEAPAGNGMTPVPAAWIAARLREGGTLKDLREQVADAAVAAALDGTGGNVRAAAARLGVTDRALHLRRANRRGRS